MSGHGDFRLRWGIIWSVVATALLCIGAFGATAGGSPAARTGSGPYFAPYVDMAAYPPPDLKAIRQDSGKTVKTISLGFVTADSGKNANGKPKCKPAWGGYSPYKAEGKHPYRARNINDFRHTGGQIVLSFGGAAGTELASACKSVKSLTSAYRKAISAYHATRLDFDVEGKTIRDNAASKRRAAALKKIQSSKTKISFTVPVTPSGLDSVGKSVIKGLRAKHVKVGVVNAMAMDYGIPGEGMPDMGDRAVGVGNALHSQLQSLMHLSSSSAWKHVGLTPMIGINDAPNEVFNTGDADQLYQYAHSHKIGMIGMWQLARDHACPEPMTTTSETCSGVPQGDYTFSNGLSSNAAR